MRWRATLLLTSRLSIQALNDRAIDGEASTLKFSTIWPSYQAVLHEGENLELFTYLSPEPLVDRILGPFEQLCIPVRAVIERDGWDSAQDVVRSEAVSQIGRQALAAVDCCKSPTRVRWC